MPFFQRSAMLTGTLSASLLAITLITGCSDTSSDAEEKASQPSSTLPSTDEKPASESSPDVPDESGKQADAASGDGSEITLSTLTEEDIREANLPGELGCQFTTDDEQSLLIAMGNVGSSDAAQGVVKVADYVERVSAPGGFDGIMESPTFSGKGKTIHIEVTGEPTDGGESPPRPATLTYDRADGAQRDWQGEWLCGP